MKRIRIYLNLMAALLLLSFPACRNHSALQTAMFPMKEGNYWSYHGKFNDMEGNLKIKVLLVRKEGNLTFALMKGFPTDIMDGEEWQPSSWGLLAVGNGHYYKVSGERTDSILKRLSNHEDALSGLVTDADLFIETLSDTGQIFGEAAQLTRNDGSYYWKVTEKHAYEPSSIQELNLRGTFDRYTLTYKTTGDDVSMDFVPGIGIVRYRCCHHGTLAELDMKLVEAVIQ